MIRHLYLFLVALCLFSSFTPMTADIEPTDFVKIEIVAEEESIQPGRPFWVAVHIHLGDGWHSYWKNPGEAGMAAAIEWTLPIGFTVDKTEWPYPHRIDSNGITGYGYEGDVWLLAKITPPQRLEKNYLVDIGANITWLVCSKDSCVPGQSTASVNVPVKFELPNLSMSAHPDFEQARLKLPAKTWQNEASLKEGVVQVKISHPTAGEFTKAEFFPEHADLIDEKKAPILLKDPADEHGYILLIGAGDAAPKAIKGVAVLRNEAGEAVPVEILASVTGDNNEHVAMLDKPVEAPELPSNEFEGGLALALVFAFLGGMILNLMPCVLPVISFKVLSFVKLAREKKSVSLTHGALFSAGIILSFWVLAGIMLILQAYGRSVGWGFQLQEPIFVAILASLLFVFALSLFGVFEMGLSMTSIAGQAQGKSGGYAGSFLSGVLATAVATPCTGPFLGSAIGFAVTLPPLEALLIFTVLGIGMAAPYLVFALFPNLIRFLPKPGPWMVSFKEIMGFLMLAAVLWLVWVFGAQTSSLGVIILLTGFFFISIGCWIFGKWGSPALPLKVRVRSYIMAGLFFLMATGAILNVTAPAVLAYGPIVDEKSTWEPFSEERIAELQAKGIPVLVDFTAKWCLICQANHLVLSTNEVSTALDTLGVVRMKADWTKNDESITRALRKFGRNGVPLYVLYGNEPGRHPEILPQVLTPDIVVGYLNRMSSPIIAEAK